MRVTVAFLFLCLAPAWRCEGKMELQPLSTVYVPFTMHGGEAYYRMGMGAAEQCTYDKRNKMVYTIGEHGLINVIDVSDPLNTTLVHSQFLPNGMKTGTDLEVCGDVLGVSMAAHVKAERGSVLIYDLYRRGQNNMELLYNISVGFHPDMLLFTHDCRRLVTCNEGEDGEDANGDWKNPEGSVSIIEFYSEEENSTEPYSVRTASFQKFDGRAEEYVSRGVRWVFRGFPEDDEEFHLSQELEPEYVTFNRDETKAYVVMQENNAVAVVDMASATVDELYSLGVKNWAESGLDASDKDGGIRINNWPIYAYYQPDCIHYLEVGGHGLLLTSNEGAVRTTVGKGQYFSEVWRGERFIENAVVAPSVPGMMSLALGDSTMLGRLMFTNSDGNSYQHPGMFDKFYTFGGRGFSLWNATTLEQIWDSGDDVEARHAQYYPSLFNSEYKSKYKDDLPTWTMDEASSDMGPQVETLTTGEVNGKILILVTCERPSSLMVYSIDPATLIPRFESIYRPGRFDKRWIEAYLHREVGDTDPEDVKFITAEDSPDGKPLVLVSGSLSGTVSLYRVNDPYTVLTSLIRTQGQGVSDAPPSEDGVYSEEGVYYEEEK
ncbi:mesenchyme-specific cell surface glycoprotein-like [Branchiostoma lanceolatum]|uniref:mesenchyme-specific cell surface glycoprotein-like n=1 Tax=Branchiostoma lanceolatum TaxID=7740 RepID=UPI0034511895